MPSEANTPLFVHKTAFMTREAWPNSYKPAMIRVQYHDMRYRAGAVLAAEDFDEQPIRRLSTLNALSPADIIRVSGSQLMPVYGYNMNTSCYRDFMMLYKYNGEMG
jgi:hypothetical protein